MLYRECRHALAEKILFSLLLVLIVVFTLEIFSFLPLRLLDATVLKSEQALTDTNRKAESLFNAIDPELTPWIPSSRRRTTGPKKSFTPS